MTKTVCDICGKEMPSDAIAIKDYRFCISSNGTLWDICNECREELNNWINQRKSGK
jgi:hypothetical protein